MNAATSALMCSRSGNGASPPSHALYEQHSLGVALLEVVLRVRERGENSILVRRVGVEETQDGLELELRRRRLTLEPALQGAPAGGGDSVHLTCANRARGRLGHSCEAHVHESFWFGIEVAFGFRPRVPKAALRLLGELVRAPRLDVEQSEDRVRRRRQFGHGT